MNQSNVIFAYLLAAFIIFITMRGELPVYLGFLLGEGATEPTGNSPSRRPAGVSQEGWETHQRSQNILSGGFNMLGTVLKSFGWF